MSALAFDVTRHNTQIFGSAKLADWYSKQALFAAEIAILGRYRSAFQGKRILDLGVGSGRTTRHLLPMASDYIGIDASEPMLDAARAAFPNAGFLAMDVRAIADLGRERFDVVVGAWAILSAFSHPERMAILAATHSLLSPGGLFVFSAHNRQWRNAGGMPVHRRSWRPRQIANSLHPVSWFNYLRLRHLRHEEPDYAILNDNAHHWRGVFYYIDRASQERQLAKAGFRLLEMRGEDGRLVGMDDDVSRDGLLHYVAEKIG